MILMSPFQCSIFYESFYDGKMLDAIIFLLLLLYIAVFLKFMHYGAVFQLTSTGDWLKIIPQSFQTQVEAQAEAMVLTESLHCSLAGGHAPTELFNHPLLSQGSLLRGPFPCTL